MFFTDPDFSKFTVLARPLPDRESRVFKSDHGDVTYGSFSLALAQEQYASRGGYVILIEHGAGREALRLSSIAGVEAGWLLSISDERQQYAALWALYKTADETRRIAGAETANKYCAAFAEGRLKKRRKNHRVYVEIAPRAQAAEVA